MDKKYCAFINGGTGSGLMTKENAIKWATDQLTATTKLQIAYIAEVTEIVERKFVPVEVRPFVLPTEQENPARKAA